MSLVFLRERCGDNPGDFPSLKTLINLLNEDNGIPTIEAKDAVGLSVPPPPPVAADALLSLPPPPPPPAPDALLSSPPPPPPPPPAESTDLPLETPLESVETVQDTNSQAAADAEETVQPPSPPDTTHAQKEDKEEKKSDSDHERDDVVEPVTAQEMGATGEIVHEDIPQAEEKRKESVQEDNDEDGVAEEEAVETGVASESKNDDQPPVSLDTTGEHLVAGDEQPPATDSPGPTSHEEQSGAVEAKQPEQLDVSIEQTAEEHANATDGVLPLTETQVSEEKEDDTQHVPVDSKAVENRTGGVSHELTPVRENGVSSGESPAPADSVETKVPPPVGSHVVAPHPPLPTTGDDIKWYTSKQQNNEAVPDPSRMLFTPSPLNTQRNGGIAPRRPVIAPTQQQKSKIKGGRRVSSNPTSAQRSPGSQQRIFETENIPNTSDRIQYLDRWVERLYIRQPSVAQGRMRPSMRTAVRAATAGDNTAEPNPRGPSPGGCDALQSSAGLQGTIPAHYTSTAVVETAPTPTHAEGTVMYHNVYGENAFVDVAGPFRGGQSRLASHAPWETREPRFLPRQRALQRADANRDLYPQNGLRPRSGVGEGLNNSRQVLRSRSRAPDTGVNGYPRRGDHVDDDGGFTDLADFFVQGRSIPLPPHPRPNNQPRRRRF